MKRRVRIIVFSAIIVTVAAGIYVFLGSLQSTTMENFHLKSSVFRDGDYIPSKFTCDGDNVNPMLEIRNAPHGTKSFALIMDDPDASNGSTWDHWLVWNIDPKTQYIMDDNLPFGSVQGKNSFGKESYGGPCPPRGNSAHRYMFELYALDMPLDLPQGASKTDLETAMQGHILEETVLMGKYGRK